MHQHLHDRGIGEFVWLPGPQIAGEYYPHDENRRGTKSARAATKSSQVR